MRFNVTNHVTVSLANSNKTATTSILDSPFTKPNHGSSRSSSSTCRKFVEINEDLAHHHRHHHPSLCFVFSLPMYIGAWTEYRLAQEQHWLKRRPQNAAQPPREIGTCPRDNSNNSTTAATRSSSKRHGGGIYHPSLVDKGGTEVAGLPNRESFRRTLNSALSSNLAADDAENISQALEPLLQRLPTIRTPYRQQRRRRRISPSGAAAAAAAALAAGEVGAGTGVEAGVGVTLRRGQQRKTACHYRTSLDRQRGRLGCRRTCSDAGTRTSRHWSTLDGMRSTRSGFSVASAPANNNTTVFAGRPSDGHRRLYLKCCDGRTTAHRGTEVEGRVPQLPLILDTRRRSSTHTPAASITLTQAAAAASVVVAPHAHRGSSTADCNINDGPDLPDGNNGHGHAFSDEEDSDRSDKNKTEEGIQKDGDGGAPHATGGANRRGSGAETTSSGGGYDRARAASILRVARRRDPARVKADFRQFWTWTKRPPRSGDEEHIGTAAARRTRDSTGTGVVPGVSRKRSNRDSGGSGGSSPSSSRVETLARMKAVYMAKIDSAVSDSLSSSDTRSSNSSDTRSVQADAVFPTAPAGNIRSNEDDVLLAAPLTASLSKSHLRQGEPNTTQQQPHLEPAPRNSEAIPAHRYMNQPDSGAGRNLGRGRGGVRSDGGISNYMDSSAVSPSVGGEQAVVVPDLELTESRIRMVDKYFGGSGGAERRRRRMSASEEVEPSCSPCASNAVFSTEQPPSGRRKNHSLGDDQLRTHGEDKAAGGLERGAAFPKAAAESAAENRGNTLPVTPKGYITGGGSNGVSDSIANVKEAIAGESAAEPRKQASRADAAVPELNKQPQPLPPATIADRIEDSACAADSTITRGTVGKAQGRLPPDISGAYLSGEGCSAWSPSPPASPFARAGCGDNASLEDLVCWTKGLDFDAAVKGF